jgi:hypothetical protein
MSDMIRQDFLDAGCTLVWIKMPAGPIDEAALARDYRKMVLPVGVGRSGICGKRQKITRDGLRRRGSFYIEAIK